LDYGDGFDWSSDCKEPRNKSCRYLCLPTSNPILYRIKKGHRFSRPQPGCHEPTIHGRELLNYSLPGRVWLVASRLGTGKTITFFHNVEGLYIIQYIEYQSVYPFVRIGSPRPLSRKQVRFLPSEPKGEGTRLVTYVPSLCSCRRSD
jgi:hypothetical protein